MRAKRQSTKQAKKVGKIGKARMVRVTSEEARALSERTDWARIDAMTDADIERAVSNDPDAAPIFTDEMFADARWVEPEAKELMSLRLDASVVKFFRATGKGFSSRMNAVLKSYVDAQRKRAPSPPRRGL